MKQREYREGPEAHKNFERTMIALFRAPKPKMKKKGKAVSSRKSKRADKD
jgi:hypothetical protein